MGMASSIKRRPHASKVFGIGLSRTGTKSLAEALRILGYQVGHYTEALAALSCSHGTLIPDFTEIDRWGALTDIPVTAVYRELDAHYPGAKFVLTVRAREAWLASVAQHFAGKARYEKMHKLDMETRYAVRTKVYGRTDFDAHDFAVAYDLHISDVRTHFAERPNHLLVIDISAGAGWEPLCRFIDVPIPNSPFPHANAAKYSKPDRVSRES
jgi:sulfotransferase family protein